MQTVRDVWLQLVQSSNHILIDNMWILVYIVIQGGEVFSTSVDLPFVDMNECFEARDMLSYKVGKGNGYFLPGSQAVCVYTGENEAT